MLKNYFTTAINNLLKNKLYSAINIIGLAVGFAAFILISLYVQNELSYDKQWEKADLIYRINSVMNNPPPKVLRSSTSVLLLSALKKYFPEDIEFGARIMRNDGEIKIGDMRYQTTIAKVDEDFVNIFQCEVLKGSLKSTLQAPGNIALSEESASKYFGDKDPIGEVISFKDTEQYKVSAVYRFTLPNTVLNISSFSLLDESKIPAIWRSWNGTSPETYIRFFETADIKSFVARLPNFVDKIIPINLPLEPGQKLSDVRGYLLQKVSDIYFNPYSDFQQKIGNKTVITVFIIISLLVLIIACINFVILTTAKATQRAREVAMRKVVGARFKQLLFQFLGESILLAFIAFLFAVAMTELALPYFETLMDSDLTVPYSSPASYIFILLLILFVGLLGGLYPAFVLSMFSPIRALKANQTTEVDGAFKLKNVLVIFQFTASIVLIIATVAAFFQLQYTSKHDPGFNPDNLIVVEGIARQDISKYRKTLKQELLKLPEVINVGLSSSQPMDLGGVTTTMLFRSKTFNLKSDQKIPIKNMYVDYNFFKAYEISLLSGRYFKQNMDQNEPALSFFTAPPENKQVTRIIINLAAVRQLGYASAHEAVGKIIESGAPDTPSEFLIIGVVADSQFRNLRLKPDSEIYRLAPDTTYFLTIRYKGNYQTAVEKAKGVWQKVVGDVTFRDSNVKQNLATAFAQEEKEMKVLIAFALLTIFIACMGLFGMAAFTVERRVKEIGLRKVMGAKVKDIVNLLGWNFLKPVIISNIIAWPVAIFAMQSWLERFPYRFNPLYMIPICMVSGLIALLIAWFTVAGNTKRVAKSNPVHALRYE